MKPEILAPVGSKESFYAAIEAGCDAVYLGGKMFGARSFANNFTNEELIEVINYAHLYGVKVYVTCNILIYEREVDKFLNYIEFLHQNHVDAVIMQDLGMIDLVHQTFPNLEIHASTQMHIHNLEGAMMAKKLGIKRIVLARETPVEVIKEIKEKSGLEVEVFVHGALCVSYSGMCLFASSIGPRSGNRGTCSGCCRLPYDVIDSNDNILNDLKYPLSMKDLMTIHELDKLKEAGIDSFKIEGRMKGASYVYTVVKMYKEVLLNYLKEKTISVKKNDLYRVNNIFSRSHTKGFVLGEDNNQIINAKSPNHQGVLVGKVIAYKNNFISILLEDSVSIHDGLRITGENLEYGLVLNEFKVKNNQVYEALKGDVITLKVNKNIPVDSKVLRTSSYKIEEEIKEIIEEKKRKVAINFKINIEKDKPIKLIVDDFKEKITILGKIPEVAKNKPTSKEEIKEKLEKIQNTVYKIETIEIVMDDNLFIPISEINHLKREILDDLTNNRLKRFDKKFIKQSYSRDVPSFKEEKQYSILTNDKSFIQDKHSVIYSETNPEYILKLAKVKKNYDDVLKNKLYLIGELGGFYHLTNVITDYSFNVVNSYSVALLHSLGAIRVTLSHELNDKQIDDLIVAYYNRYQKRPNLELITKTNLEVMVLKYKFSLQYQNPIYLQDRFKNRYKIVEKNDLTYLYDMKRKELYNEEKYFDLGISCLREEYYE